MTQSSAPGFVVVVEDGGFTLRRSHDLSLCCTVKCSTYSAASCATLREVGGEQYEIIVGFETGQVAVWALNLRDHCIGSKSARGK